MPKSKRDKKGKFLAISACCMYSYHGLIYVPVSLTRTTKKGPLLKKQLVEEIRKCTESYARAFVFAVFNMRNNTLKDVREEWKQSR